MNWSEVVAAIKEAQSKNDNALAFKIFDDAKRRFHSKTNKDYDWLIEALKNDDLKFFVAHLFQRTSLPKKLLIPMLQAALCENNASLNNEFIKPCLATYDKNKVKKMLINLENELSTCNLDKVLYWVASYRSRS